MNLQFATIRVPIRRRCAAEVVDEKVSLSHPSEGAVTTRDKQISMNFQGPVTQFRPLPPCQQSILTIPPEITIIIFDCCPFPDQICLALTCKILYTQYLFFLRARKLQLSKLLSPNRRPIMHRNIKNLQNWPRIQLLHRLEDERWRYCSGCWCLHRRSAWTHPSKLWLLRSIFRRPPMCLSWAGSTDVCTCLTMTISDMFHLMAMLQSITARDRSAPRQYYFDGLFYHRWKSLAHGCDFSRHPLANVSIRVRCEWSDRGLVIETDYRFRTKMPFEKTETPSHVSLKTPFMCPHENCKRWLRLFLDEAGRTSFKLRKNCQVFKLVQCKCSVAEEGLDPYHGLELRVRSIVKDPFLT